MKVLVVTNMYPDKTRPYNGIFVAEQVEAVAELHPDVCFDVCYVDGAKGKTEYLKSVFYVNRKIRRERYDLVHIHFGLSGMFLFSPFTPDVPTLITFHGSDIQPKGGNGFLTLFTSRHAAKVADACVTLNQEMDTMVRAYCERTFIIPCAVDTSVFKPIHRQRSADKVRIVFPCSHDMSVKNYPLFVSVMNLLREKYGIDCIEEELNGLTRQQVAELFNEADLMLMTSNSEGSPQAVKEAMACNLPVVSTPVGDVKELLQGVKDCYVSKEHNAKELAELVVRSLSHQGEGMTGYEKIQVMRLDKDSVADKIYDIYKEMTTKNFS